MSAIINDKLILSNFSSYSVSDSIKAKIESYVNKANITPDEKELVICSTIQPIHIHLAPQQILMEHPSSVGHWGGPCTEYKDKDDRAMLKEHHHHITNHKHLWNTICQTLF